MIAIQAAQELSAWEHFSWALIGIAAALYVVALGIRLVLFIRRFK